MSRIILFLLSSICWLTAGSEGFAAPKPVAILYVSGSASHDAAIKRMILQAHNDLGLTLKELPISNESQLAEAVEKIADDGFGLIIIVQPRNMDALSKIPGLYPDIHFSVIGALAPVYVSNVQSLMFRDEEGSFMIGVLAAGHAVDKPVGFISGEDDNVTRNLAYGFFQGATYARPSIEVLRQLGSHSHDGKAVSGVKAIEQQFGKGVDSVFVADSSLVGPASRLAQQQHRLIITADDAQAELPGVMLTRLRIRTDLAMYDTLKAYLQGGWKPDSRYLGVGGGYIDYVLSDSNKTLLSPALIEKVENAKDLMAQGAIKVKDYTIP